MWRCVTGFYCANYRWKHILPCLPQPPPAHLALKPCPPHAPPPSGPAPYFFPLFLAPGDFVGKHLFEFPSISFFLLVFVSPLGPGAEVLLKMTFGFTAMALGLHVTPLWTGAQVWAPAGPLAWPPGEQKSFPAVWPTGTWSPRLLRCGPHSWWHHWDSNPGHSFLRPVCFLQLCATPG